VAQRILCWICLTVADERAKGWRAYRFDDEPEPSILFCCPRCARRGLRPVVESAQSIDG
jgi:hypothetical protein